MKAPEPTSKPQPIGRTSKQPFLSRRAFHRPDTGVIVRLITQAGLKPTDFVHQEDMRIDYAPLVIDGRERMLPADSFTITEVVPNGDNYAARYSIRHTVFVATYQDYQMADSVNPGSK